MNQVICPKCKAVLNPENRVVLSTKNKNGEWGLTLLSPELGDYNVINHESFQIQEGDNVKFYCPACHGSLSDYASIDHLAIMELIDENQSISTILISSVAGEKCTYKILDGKMESFGNDSQKYHFDYQNLIDLV